MNIPSTNGRSDRGRFTAGNSGGPGNPHAAQVAKLRAAMLEAVTEDELKLVLAKLLDMAKGGDLAAIKMLLDRTIGKPQEAPIFVVQQEPEMSPEEQASVEVRRAKVLAAIGRLK